MKDILILKDNFVQIEDKTLTVILPLTIPEFNIIYETIPDGNKVLSYVALLGSYNSHIAIKGLTGNEAHEAACKNVNLPLDFNAEPTVDKKVKDALKVFDDHYKHGVFGVIKELYKSYELTRQSISLINAVLHNSQKAIKEKLKGDLKEEDVKSLTASANDIIITSSKVRDIASAMESDISNLKLIEAKVIAAETNEIEPLGGGSIPKTARRNG